METMLLFGHIGHHKLRSFHGESSKKKIIQIDLIMTIDWIFCKIPSFVC